MESRVTSDVAAGRSENGRGPEILGPDTGSASGRSTVTRPDKGVAPATGRATPAPTHGSVGVAELTHAEVRDRLSDHVDGTLSETDRRRVDGHLAVCRGCSAYRATFKATVDATEHLPRPMAPTGARARIVDRVRRLKESENGQ
jgi:hypothetical protein